MSDEWPESEGVCSWCRARLPAIELMAWRFRWAGQVSEGLLCAGCEDELDLAGDLVAEPPVVSMVDFIQEVGYG